MAQISSLTQFTNGTPADAPTVNANLETLRLGHNAHDTRLDTLETETRPVNEGGTGLASYTAGDLLYASGATTLAKLAKGTTLQYLRMNSGATAPEWATLVVNDFKEYGLAITTGTDTEHDVDIAAGARWDSTYASKITYAGGTIAIDAAAGINSIDAGTVANSTMYYIWICSGATGTGAIFSTSSTAPTLPAGYNTYKALIGARITDSSANIDTTQSWTRHPDGTWTYEYVQATGNFPNANVVITHNLGTKEIVIEKALAVNNSTGVEYNFASEISTTNIIESWKTIDSTTAITLQIQAGFYIAVGASGTDISNSASYRLKVRLRSCL